MSALSIFEDFSLGPNTASFETNPEGDPLEGYESGYQAGWEDALKAQQDTKTHLGSSLAQNLEQIEFTLVEAQTQLFAALKPVIEEVVTTLLPSLNSAALRSLVEREIDVLLKENMPNDITLLVSRTDEPVVTTFLNSTSKLSEIAIASKDTIGEGQAYVSCAMQQRKIDVSQAISEIKATIESFLEQPELEPAHAV